LDKVVKRDDIENIVSSIMGKLVINLKKEIKQEIMIEVGKETTKIRKEYNEKIVNYYRSLHSFSWNIAHSNFLGAWRLWTYFLFL
jgi:hypothetical protein